MSAIEPIRQQGRYHCYEVPVERPTATLAEDALTGLWSDPRQLSPKYFYDTKGSQLFDQICDTPEYYPTRTEAALLAQHARAIIDAVQPDHIIELGSGTSRKTRYLLDACAEAGLTATYWPYDVCEPLLHEVGEQLLTEYSWLNVNALVGDYSGGLGHLPNPEGRCLYVFLGGTIGNFTAQQADTLLSELKLHMQADDALLLGADRVKDVQVLHDAYNDAQGVTAAFNLNLLSVLNEELGADFQLSSFRHQAIYNETDQQIEMYLLAAQAQNVHLAELDRQLQLAKGERVLTEISRKFTEEKLLAQLSRNGMTMRQHYEPRNHYYSLMLAVVE